MHFAIIIGAAWYTENFLFRVTPFAYKTLLLFIPYHLVSINLVTIIAYGVDKRAAKKGNWRVPEIRLHTLELLGGWIGAFIAQKIFRHKTKKKSFQAMFWLMLVLQVSAIYYILTFLKIIK
ncbi:MAG: DUF1294 domain-containing protein [Alphaproteobacteria bacterium]|nr:DUF1294 domain-containing protein [Alphaproteobacteria bacterium]